MSPIFTEIVVFNLQHFHPWDNHPEWSLSYLVRPIQDVTEEDIESELAVIHSQMAYVMQLQGRTDEALQLYNQVIKLKWVQGSSHSF